MLSGIGQLPALAASLPTRLQRRLSGGAYRPEIDGLRFIAIAIVVIGHFVERAVRFFPQFAEHRDSLAVDLLSRPGLGVMLFFAVSGFILASQAMRSSDSPLSGAFLRGYFARRVLRIEPPYLILLALTWAALMASGYRPENTNHFATGPDSLTMSLFGSIFYVHDLLWGTSPRLFPPGWSLEIEVQFYLLAPVLFFAYFRLSGWPRRLCGAALLALGALLSLYTPHRLGGLYVFDSILRFFHFFWLGILLADGREAIAAAMRRLPKTVAAAAGFLALAAFVAAPAPLDDPSTPAELARALGWRALALLATTTMFACVFAPSSFRAFCANRWISLIGGACYSIYLTHLQVIQLLTSQIAKHAAGSPVAAVALYGVVAIAAVLVIGLAYYAAIERTFMIKDWPSRVRRALRADRSRENVTIASNG